jgi:hypothetical protein
LWGGLSRPPFMFIFAALNQPLASMPVLRYITFLILVIY